MLQACGMWPTEFCKGFVPETWGIRLIEGLSALVSLVVAAENVELDEVRQETEARFREAAAVETSAGATAGATAAANRARGPSPVGSPPPPRRSPASRPG